MRAATQVEATRDDPAGRLALLAEAYRGPYGDARRHLPFRRAALSFMRWQLDRGVLNPLTATPPGSPWWRAVNERILRDTCEAVARSGGLGGEPSSPTIAFGMAFRVEAYLEMERGLGRLLDYGVIGARLQLLYEWAARELDQPGRMDLICDGSPVYAWPFAQRWVWRPGRRSTAARVLRRLTAPR